MLLLPKRLPQVRGRITAGRTIGRSIPAPERFATEQLHLGARSNASPIGCSSISSGPRRVTGIEGESRAEKVSLGRMSADFPTISTVCTQARARFRARTPSALPRGPRMSPIVNLAQVRRGEVRVDLRRNQAFMAEQLLDTANVRPAI